MRVLLNYMLWKQIFCRDCEVCFSENEIIAHRFQLQNAAVMLSSWQRPPLLLDPYLTGADWCAVHLRQNRNITPVNLAPKIDSAHVTAVEKAVLGGMFLNIAHIVFRRIFTASIISTVPCLFTKDLHKSSHFVKV